MLAALAVMEETLFVEGYVEVAVDLEIMLLDLEVLLVLLLQVLLVLVLNFYIL